MEYFDMSCLRGRVGVGMMVVKEKKYVTRVKNDLC